MESLEPYLRPKPLQRRVSLLLTAAMAVAMLLVRTLGLLTRALTAPRAVPSPA